MGRRITQHFPFSVTPASSADLTLTVAYTSESDWSVEWGHSLYASPAYRQRQIGPNHAGLLFFDGDNDPSEVEMGDDTNITEIDVRLRNDNDADVEGVPDERMRLRVTRKKGSSSGAAELFDMSYGSVVLGDSLSELTMLLPKKYVYGLGGHGFSFGERNGSAFVKKTAYNMEHLTKEGHQSAVPVFLAMDSERNFFGVHIESERPLTIQVLPGLQTTSAEFEPLLALRSMGGFMLVHVFPGPSPRDVVTQGPDSIGKKNIMKNIMKYHVNY